MVTAVVLIKAETDQVTGLAEKLAELDGVEHVAPKLEPGTR